MPVIPRAEMLAELMRLKYGVAVAGSHGKTTTTSMVALVLDKGGLDPTVVVGGRLGVLGSGARLGKGDFMVAEADESDRSFLKLTPTVAVVTNIDREHLDTYRDLADVQEAFLGFVNKVPVLRRGGAVPRRRAGAGHPAARRAPGRHLRPLAAGPASPRATCSSGPRARPTPRPAAARPLGPIDPGRARRPQRGELARRGGRGPRPGRPLRRGSSAGLASFTGVDRRFQVRGEAGGVLVVDDYGHHPTEIRATLETLRAPRRRAADRGALPAPPLHAHAGLWDDFCRAFHQADVLLADRHLSGGRGADPGRHRARALAQAIAERGPPATSAYAGDLAGGRRSGWPRRRRTATSC